MRVYRSHGAESAAAIVIAARTDVGLCREHNEDAFLISDLAQGLAHGPPVDGLSLAAPLGVALGVYDGSGGASSPDAASRLAARAVHAALAQRAPRTSDDLARRLVEAVVDAGRGILEHARRHPKQRSSGTTATVAALCDARLLVAQVGDSRGYLLRDGALTQITRDQTLVQRLLDSGKLRPDEAATFEHRTVMLQALGLREHVRVALSAVELRRGDTLLLCTDGLTEMVDDGWIGATLGGSPDPGPACDALIEGARRAGGRDNATVVVARFDGPWLDPPAGAALRVDEIVRFSYGDGHHHHAQ